MQYITLFYLYERNKYFIPTEKLNTYNPAIESGKPRKQLTYLETTGHFVCTNESCMCLDLKIQDYTHFNSISVSLLNLTEQYNNSTKGENKMPSTPQHCPGFTEFKNLKSFECSCPSCGEKKEIFSDEFDRSHICEKCGKEIDFNQCTLEAGASSSEPA